MSEGSDPAEPDVRREGERSPGSFAFGDDLELNRFDGLPFSSRYYKLLKERKTLPVWKVKCEFEDALVSSHVVIVSGTARTGTSTQIPQWCAEFCLSARYQHGVAACTQTSRRRAVDLALRVADEMDVNVGHEVGYAIPLETCCSSDTVLRYCTDDMLLREMLSDPFLEHYGVIIVDQAHNRTVSTDILLGLLRDILLHRPELRVVVLAVGPTVDRLRRHFGNVPLIRLEASCTAEVVHSTGTGTSQDHFYSALRLVLELHRSKEDGDVAVFLASDEEVPCAYRILRREGTRLGVDLGPLEPVVLGPGQSGPPPALSAQPTPKKPRRVYLCSRQGEDLCWAAEAVGFVIDAGVQKKMVYNPRIRANSEALQPISQCQADIRKQLSEPGGKFFCLYSEEKQLPAENSPQILESNITATVLFLKRMEIAGLRQCDFIDRPDPEGLMQALEELDYLAALDDDGNLSEMGIIMSEIPLEPQLAKALLASCEFDCVSEMLTMAAMLSDFSAEKWCQDYFLDHSALTKAEAIRSELSDTLHRIELPVSEPSFGTKANALSIRRALLAGFFMQIARDVDGCGNYFILTHKHMAQVHPLSCYGAQSHKMGLPEWVVFHEYMLSENCMRTVSQISPREFIQMAPLYFFYNLPPSESKDILQDMLDPDGSRKRKEEKQTDAALSSDGNNGCAVALQTYDRCAIQ
ncbi:DEAD/H (Asp-Glu-Ala-Asp/His) box polypeptide 32a isoform X2 [Betta splendens]|uniref:DEAD/H (Asp-Glu-Ala-Asp/His) box polypeptide 32a isoform X2 n=1 Tax=Betta splendens TaxID=158456 RepID=A0A8M1H7Q5_BETSP|nr:DEAD/H (Asp-Glu-Ala-Asp/His) box polypeptide 32a isoform X2 [Betta splendens]